jgi:aromatic ring-opening dioxygenase catalytic subunit (LigB family)
MPADAGSPKGMLSDSTLSQSLRSTSELLSKPPTAILLVSAHWETGPELAVTSSPRPSLVFDYSGFPPETYEYKYPCRGDPELAQRTVELLNAAGHACQPDEERGYDHGVFVPLMLAFPDADVPVVALSLHKSLDPAMHLSIGRALSPLRDDGVLILGSGLSFHNMAAFSFSGNSKSGDAKGERWDSALNAAVTAEPAVREAALTKWAELPDARASHPREEHLLPLLVVAGAGGEDLGQNTFRDRYMGVIVSNFRFG